MPITAKKQETRAGGRGRVLGKNRPTLTAVSLISLMLAVGALLPTVAQASVLSIILASFRGNVANAQAVSGAGSIQSVGALKPAMNIDPSPAKGGGDITIVDDSALVPEEGPSGMLPDIEKPKNATISTYIVHEGDTVTSIAKLFGVSVNTVRGANSLSVGSKLTVGQKLVILPITGVRYTVKSGDTIASIAKKYGADATEIANSNGVDDTTLATGTDIIIPDVEIALPAPTPKAAKKSSKISESAQDVGPRGSVAQIGYYSAPLSSYTKTQGIHGYNGVDLAAPAGTPVMASASGEVVVAKAGGYNGGYGSYVVIQHGNGSQTLYSHLSKVSTYDGESVVQGEVIGYVGSTGKSTGNHLHFEIRNGVRNPF